MSLFVHLVRHGETAESREHGFCGSRDCLLTPDGLQMARSIASRRASDGDWQAVLSSPLVRDVDTARPAAKALGLDIKMHDGLREIAVAVIRAEVEAEFEPPLARAGLLRQIRLRFQRRRRIAREIEDLAPGRGLYM